MLLEQDRELANLSKLQPGQFQSTEDKFQRDIDNQQIDELYEQAVSRRVYEDPEEVKEEFVVHEEEPTTTGSRRQQVQGAMRSPDSPPRQGLTTAAPQQVNTQNVAEEVDEETFGVLPPTQQTERKPNQDRGSILTSMRGLPTTGKRDPILDSTEGAKAEDNLLKQFKDDQTESYFRDADFDKPDEGVDDSH
mmetsp:Transcript_39022/g.59414  ORF Transcript_39022/g.59414 Transcript_39022/m.59414 type:complete len:192 (+) Transcript_39022:5799-6374(+)